MKPLLVKSADEAAPFRATMVPLGKYHSPTFPPSLSLQQSMLTLLVTHTRDESASVPEIPIAVMSIVSSGRYTIPFSVKYRPEAGAATGNIGQQHTILNQNIHDINSAIVSLI